MMIKSVLLSLPVGEAFDLFTSQISVWWPADRRHTGDPKSTIVLSSDGSFTERSADGQAIDLGKVTLWQAPRLIVLDFYIATGPDHPTEVEIRFDPEGDDTRVTVTHRPKPESQHLWDERAPRYERSWESVLAALRSAAY